jgi:hypothetical protein
VRAFVYVWVDPPLQFDVCLAPQSKFGWNELTDKPSAAANLVGLGVAGVQGKVERLFDFKAVTTEILELVCRPRNH